MRIVSRAAFLAMPAGTVFAKYRPQVFEPLAIKGESWYFESGGNDFWEKSLHDAVDAVSSDELDRILTVAEETGGHVALNFECEGRDGLFDKDQLFAVWDAQDVKQLIARLEETLE